jgi:hypothetical protein
MAVVPHAGAHRRRLKPTSARRGVPEDNLVRLQT